MATIVHCVVSKAVRTHNPQARHHTYENLQKQDKSTKEKRDQLEVLLI